ncbi:MAG: hypothetical protein ACLFPE_04505, partial [Bacteroidales bacterium]
IDFEERSRLYPASEFFTGFSHRDVGKEEDLGEVIETLRREAVSHLSNSIRVTVQSVTTLNTLELNKQVYQEFRENLALFSRVDLSGIETKDYYDKRKRMAYALAFVKKEKLISHYNALIAEQKDKIGQWIKIARGYMEAGDPSGALSAYMSCMPLFAEVDEAVGIVMLLEASRTGIDQVREFEVEVKQAIAELYQSNLLTLDDVCGFIAWNLSEQAGTLDGEIRIANITFEDTKMNSQLSRRIAGTLGEELIKLAGYHIVDPDDLEPGVLSAPGYLIKGTYWDEGDRVKITATLRSVADGKPLATADGFLPKKWIREMQVSWKPENFAEAQNSLHKFSAGEIVNQNLSLEVWTNHGNDSPVFEAGDTLRFYIRVNAPCYVRIVNHFADGTRVLLVDDMYIGSDKVNKVVKISDEFTCEDPFGVEILQVNVQSEKFPPLITEEKWGYTFIKNNLEELISNSRGFKPIKNEDLRAEERIIVTTMDI